MLIMSEYIKSREKLINNKGTMECCICNTNFVFTVLGSQMQISKKYLKTYNPNIRVLLVKASNLKQLVTQFLNWM